jgi:23S rRNA (uridine2552-2'-O)-methyltransferase
MEQLFAQHQISTFDVILSDLAPDTIGHASTDALRSIAILEKLLPLYERWLSPDGSRVTKIFMGPGFEEYVADAKKMFGPKTIFVFKPKACRKDSKETYVVRKVK